MKYLFKSNLVDTARSVPAGRARSLGGVQRPHSIHNLCPCYPSVVMFLSASGAWYFFNEDDVRP